MFRCSPYLRHSDGVTRGSLGPVMVENIAVIPDMESIISS